MVANRGRDTKPERALRSELHRRGLRFRVDIRPLRGLNCRADLVFPSERVAVFVDGCFWHGCTVHAERPRRNSGYWNAKIDANIARDRRNDAVLTQASWCVIRVWEHEPLHQSAELVEEAVRVRRSRPEFR
jgi:DNA mismatch endonuclease, patch repair protein